MSIKKILFVFLCLGVLAIDSFSVFYGAAYAAEPAKIDARTKLFDDLKLLVEEYYAKAKITMIGDKIHFEYKVRPQMTNNNRKELIPDFGGVLGDLEFKHGPYAGRIRLPQKYSEYAFYSVILLAPFSQSNNTHVYTRLAYPSDTLQDFTDRFEDIVNSFADTPAQTGYEETVVKPNPPNGTAPSSSSSTSGSRLCLWKATRGNMSVLIFATIHYGKNRYYALTGEIGNAFLESKQLAFDEYSALQDSDLYKSGLYDSSDKLSSHLSAETKQILDDYLAWTDEPLSMFEIWKPYAVLNSFDESLVRKIGFNNLKLSEQFRNEAETLAKPILELDPTVAEVKRFQTLPDSVQDLCVRLSILELLDYETTQSQIEDAWRKGEIDRLTSIALRKVNEHKELAPAYDELYQNNNAAMVSKLEENLSKGGGSIFVSLDFRHVLGDKGILAVFKSHNFKVEQMSGLPMVIEPGVLTALPYKPPKEDLAPTEAELFDQAVNLFDDNKFKETQAIIAKMKPSPQTHCLNGLCFQKLNKRPEAMAEFHWVLRFSKNFRLRELALSGLYELTARPRGKGR